MESYEQFLNSKRIVAPPSGYTPPSAINSRLFDWQAAVVDWACRRGSALLAEECGLGKTAQQLEWAQQGVEHSGGDFLIAAPLAVNLQTIEEGRKFGIDVNPARCQDEVRRGINITNYEMLENFDSSYFKGIVIDEGSILKSFMGATKRRLIEMFANTPYRLSCSATPAPNDHMEIGNQAEFLGIMPANEMLSRWFINDTMNFGTYRLKGHATADFWDWVASWCVAMRRPSDIGFNDDGYILPPLNMHQINVEVDPTEDAGEALFRMPTMSATTMHQEMRRTTSSRARAAADLINADSDYWAAWCNTNYEADELKALIPDAIEVRGNDSIKAKEEKLMAFTHGNERVIITKPSIAGFGLNWQHCHKSAHVGLSYSFEQLYQAIRRVYRFGQTQPVEAYLIVAETEGPVLQSVQKKMAEHQAMMDGMNSSTRKLKIVDDRELTRDRGDRQITVPSWLRAA